MLVGPIPAGTGRYVDRLSPARDHTMSEPCGSMLLQTGDGACRRSHRSRAARRLDRSHRKGTIHDVACT